MDEIAFMDVFATAQPRAAHAAAFQNMGEATFDKLAAFAHGLPADARLQPIAIPIDRLARLVVADRAHDVEVDAAAAGIGAQMAAARVRGFQGKDLSALDTIAACAKHYAAYGFAEAGRDYNTVDISEQTLRNVVLPPFKAASDAGVATFMNSFNEIGGIPATGNAHLQRDILKGEWGFQGFVVSDWGSIGEMVPHGYSESLEQAAQQAITAGSDMDMEARAYIGHLAALVKAGKVDPKLVDDAVRRVLRVKFALGLFDDPYRYSDAAREKQVLANPADGSRTVPACPVPSAKPYVGPRHARGDASRARIASRIRSEAVEC